MEVANLPIEAGKSPLESANLPHPAVRKIHESPRDASPTIVEIITSLSRSRKTSATRFTTRKMILQKTGFRVYWEVCGLAADCSRNAKKLLD